MEEKKDLAETILEFWKTDSVIDRYSAGDESSKIPKLHYKYLNLLRQVNAKLIELRDKKNKMYLKKNNFYGGKDDPHVYREKNFHLKVLKADMDTYIKADDEFAAVSSKIAEFESAQEILKSILEQLKNRHWQLRIIVDYDRLTSGQ